MRKRRVVLGVVGVLALSAAPAGGAARAEDARLFAGGTTPLGGGFFFPGTGVSDGNKMRYVEPLQVSEGSNIEFTTFDEGSVSNIHQIRSLEVNKRTKRPLFSSKPVRSPGDSVTVITSHLKPGVYKYRCTTHANMFGAIEVVKG